MEKRQLIRMVLSFVLPPILMILLFIGAISFYIIPSTEEALMQKKKDTVRAVVVSATSILEKHAQLDHEGKLTLEEAQKLALMEMRALRYGNENQEYIWITDQQPRMLMHPFYPEMEGSMLDTFTDSRGNLLFLEAEAMTREHGEGFIDYMWSKGRNVEEAVPKLSYVKLLQPWGWIVGSGIYLDDVQLEIRTFTTRLLVISGLIGGIVLLLLLFVVHRGWKSETGRYLAEKELIRSHERYRALAHASEEMIFLVIDDVVAGANRKACENLEMKEKELIGRKFSELTPDDSGQALIAAMTAGNSNAPVATIIQGKSTPRKVMLSAEHAVVHDRPAILYTCGSLIQSEQQENIPFILELFRKNGFGIVLLDSPQNGRIVIADHTAALLLTGNADQEMAGEAIQKILTASDWQHMLLQLLEEKRAERVLLTPRDGENRKILAWAVLLNEEKTAKGKVALLLLDDSGPEIARRVVEDLLSAAISPERLLSPNASRACNGFSTAGNGLHFLHAITIVRLAMKEGLHAEKATAIVTRSIDTIFQEGVAAAIDVLGPPPCPYAFLVLGSLGRREPTLHSDQDTAIIYADGGDGDDRQTYFRQLGVFVTDFAATAGLPPCDAGNSANNPDWCLSETAWHKLFTTYITTASPEDILQVNILFDLRTVVGEDAFTSRLRRQIFTEVAARPIFLYYLAQSTLDFRLPSDILGRLRAEGPGGNSVNLKGIMLHFVNFVRIYALQHEIIETNTIDRLEALATGKHLPPDIIEETFSAWKFLLQMRFDIQVVAQEKNFSQKNIILIDTLNSWDQTMLKMAASQVGNLQRRLSTDFVNRT